ncbi:hypothetical protein LR48_Vigan464s001800 [Vigna angularis]|uniref:Serine-threonine/tyrosine-protein kinase catalytic domain-containing protein n=1 Tax=Phaseolus angularis TaxID=3914 RepID=A0A0L9TBN9_PHAAN|nr:hypothetical protein LR48_Vigan464s001800 [Vigna angularis]
MNDFSQENLIGTGGFGEVFKGTFDDGTVFSIKRAKFGSTKGIDQMRNEVRILCQVNHRSLVKLLGCCLELEHPLLIHEQTKNQNKEQSKLNHNKEKASRMSGKECRSGSLGGAVTTAEHFTQTSLLSVSTSRGRRRGGDREASEEQALEGNDDGRVFEQEPLELERGPDAEEKGGVSAKERGDVSHDDEGVEGGEEGGGGGEEEGELSEDKGEPHDKEGDGLKAEGTRMATTGVPPRFGMRGF